MLFHYYSFCDLMMNLYTLGYGVFENISDSYS